MKRAIAFLIFGWIFFATPCGLRAQSPAPASFPRLEPDPRAAGFAGRFAAAPTWRDLAETALWASGEETGPGRTSALPRIEEAVAALAASPDLPPGKREQGDFILHFIHERYLKAYSETQTRLDVIFANGNANGNANGRYNCVSSAVFYLILAQSLGLNVRGVMTKDHAFITFRAGDEDIDVETTNPYGFDPGNRRDFHDQFGKLTGFAYVPARNYRDRASISPLELVSLILSNRIADLEGRNRFSEAVPLALDRAALLAGRSDPVHSPLFTDPRDDVLDRLFNYGGFLVRSGREGEALDWAAIAGSRFPAGERWEEFAYAAANNFLVKLQRAGRTAEARAALDRYAPQLSPAHYDLLDAMLLEAGLVRLVSGITSLAGADAALEAVASAESRRLIDSARITELRVAVLLKKGSLIAEKEGNLAAIAFAGETIARYGNNSRLVEMQRVFQANRAGELHNAFAALFNRGAYEEARRAVLTALEEFPADRRLQSDLTLAEQALRRR